MSSVFSGLLILVLCCHVGGALKRASGVSYIGRGYDIVDGNPDGVSLGGTPPASASDPGIKQMSWFDLTYKGELTDVEGRFLIPDQISYQPESSCMDTRSTSVITSDQQYQKKLSTSVSIDADAKFGFAKFAFSASMTKSSHSVQNIKSKKVYLEQNVVCSYGSATYRFGNKKKFLNLSNDAVRLICRLPTYVTNQYYEFIGLLGTHFISSAHLGSKQVHRKETVMTSFFESVLQTSGANSGVSASYMGMGGSLGVQVNSESLSKNSENIFGSEEVSWNIGNKEYHMPTTMKLTPITELLDKKTGMWDKLCQKTTHKGCCSRLDTIKETMEKALISYPTEYRKIEPPSSQPVTFELVWPEGTYALHRVNNKCPKGHGFKWAKGTVFQDTDDWNEENKWSSGIKWASYQLEDSSISQMFCVKGIDNANDYELQWPRGDYCINRYRSCPRGFIEGFVKFDDENMYNKNWRSGSVPDGVYDEDSKLYYCCRNDGSPLEPVRLPSTHEFYLVRRGTQCQTVHNTRVKTEWVEWSLESWWGLDEDEMKGGQFHPYVIIRDEKLRMYFCLYTPVEVKDKETIVLDVD